MDNRVYSSLSTQPKHTYTYSELPPEVWLHVLSFLLTPELFLTSLLSKHFYQLSLRILYQDIYWTTTTVDGLNHGNPSSARIMATSVLGGEDGMRLVYMVKKCTITRHNVLKPTMGAHRRGMADRAAQQTNPFHLRGPPLANTITQMTNLHTLSLSLLLIPEIIISILPTLDNLRTLSLRGCQIESVSFQPQTIQPARITNLTLVYVRSYLSLGARVLRPPQELGQHLPSINADMDEDPPDDGLSALLQAIVSPHLQILHTTSFDLPSIRQAFSLALQPEIPGHAFKDDSDSEVYEDSSLHTLSMHFHRNTAAHSRALYQFLRVYGKGLERLEILGCSGDDLGEFERLLNGDPPPDQGGDGDGAAGGNNGDGTGNGRGGGPAFPLMNLQLGPAQMQAMRNLPQAQWRHFMHRVQGQGQAVPPGQAQDMGEEDEGTLFNPAVARHAIPAMDDWTDSDSDDPIPPAVSPRQANRIKKKKHQTIMPNLRAYKGPSRLIMPLCQGREMKLKDIGIRELMKRDFEGERRGFVGFREDDLDVDHVGDTRLNHRRQAVKTREEDWSGEFDSTLPVLGLSGRRYYDWQGFLHYERDRDLWARRSEVVPAIDSEEEEENLLRARSNAVPGPSLEGERRGDADNTELVEQARAHRMSQHTAPRFSSIMRPLYGGQVPHPPHANQPNQGFAFDPPNQGMQDAFDDEVSDDSEGTQERVGDDGPDNAERNEADDLMNHYWRAANARRAFNPPRRNDEPGRKIRTRAVEELVSNYLAGALQRTVRSLERSGMGAILERLEFTVVRWEVDSVEMVVQLLPGLMELRVRCLREGADEQFFMSFWGNYLPRLPNLTRLHIFDLSKPSLPPPTPSDSTPHSLSMDDQRVSLRQISRSRPAFREMSMTRGIVWIRMEARASSEVTAGRGWGYYIRDRWRGVYGDDPAALPDTGSESKAKDIKGKGRGKSRPQTEFVRPINQLTMRDSTDRDWEDDEDEDMAPQREEPLIDADTEPEDWVVPGSGEESDNERQSRMIGRRINALELSEHQEIQERQRDPSPQLVPNVVDTEMSELPDPFLYEGDANATQEMGVPKFEEEGGQAGQSHSKSQSRSHYDFDYEAISQSNHSLSQSISSHSVHSSTYQSPPPSLHSFHSPFVAPSAPTSLSASASISTPASHAMFNHPNFTALQAQALNQTTSSQPYQLNYQYGTSPYDQNHYEVFDGMYNMNIGSLYEYDRTGGYETEGSFYDTRMLYETHQVEGSVAENVQTTVRGQSHGSQISGEEMLGMRSDVEEDYGFVEIDEEIDVPSFMWN